MTQQPEQSAPGITYAAAGVDTAAGDRAVALMKDAVAATMTPAVVGDAHRPPASPSPLSARHRTFDPSPQGAPT